MACQLIFVVESDEKSQSDYLYIRAVLNNRYKIIKNNDIKISSVFMGGKGNYNKKKTVNKINGFKRQYSKNGESYVIYCFDTDQFEIKHEDKTVLDKEKQYCKENGYDFVWFCHTVEEVFWGEVSAKADKTKKAILFSAKPKLQNVDLKSNMMRKGKSNLMIVLDKYL